MADVNLPTPVALAGRASRALGGCLLDRFRYVAPQSPPEPGHHAVPWIYGDVLPSAR